MSDGASQQQAIGVMIQQYQTLLAVAESISMHHDLAALFHDLAQHLPRVVRFNFVDLILHDPVRNVMRLHVLETAGKHKAPLNMEWPIDKSPGGWVWQMQQPLLVRDVKREERFADLLGFVREHGIQSCCWVPLTTPQRRLGAMGFGSVHPDMYGENNLTFLQQVADQVAIAVSNVLYAQEAHVAQQQLTRERDRLRLLLDINNAVVSTLDLHDLLTAISSCLRRVLQHECTSLTLYDTETSQLRLYALDFPGSKGLIQENLVAPLDSSISGAVFTSRQPKLVTTEDLQRFQSDLTQRHYAEGIRSGCVLPLMTRNRVLGTLILGSLREHAFTQEDLEFLNQVANQIAIAVENALAFREIAALKDKLSEEKLYLEDEIRTAYHFDEIIGESPGLKRVLKQVEIVAPTGSAVLILGETGTGKELIARAVHNLSARREHTFVKLNCAAIPTGLLESELFGHERGAFTGAIAQKIGRFELAHRGTLFLDEVGDIPLELQPKLLRVLQEQEFERLGGTRTIRVDVRLIAATNRDLAQMAANKEFRSDLYYRLNVFPLLLPPLRERSQDILPLVRYFTQKYARRMNKRIETIPTETITALSRYSWPGNVRELENFIERAVILSPGPVLQAPLTELKTPTKEPVSQTLTLVEAEREHIVQVLRETKGVVGGPRGAAARLGMKRTTLQSKMRKLGITSSSYA
ncbi:MAG TPA: sigma 54-interacting transcriptional regulator [Methylomirabilota bacterium]|jgi:formate hydrogenlyase transcriptional activator|nr:sigma 54-interacting transcriptional regulator [Methylomirabilota bacterium]